MKRLYQLTSPLKQSPVLLHKYDAAITQYTILDIDDSAEKERSRNRNRKSMEKEEPGVLLAACGLQKLLAIAPLA